LKTTTTTNERLTKMKTKQYAALAIIAVAAGACLALNPHAQSEVRNSQPQAYKLEGAWIAKVVGMPMQWAYTMSPDPSGKRAALSGSIHVPIPPQVILTQRSSLIGSTTPIWWVNWS
jgi:hypothetical protein